MSAIITAALWTAVVFFGFVAAVAISGMVKAAKAEDRAGVGFGLILFPISLFLALSAWFSL